jgi:hypothetical protein
MVEESHPSMPIAVQGEKRLRRERGNIAIKDKRFSDPKSVQSLMKFGYKLWKANK